MGAIVVSAPRPAEALRPQAGRNRVLFPVRRCAKRRLFIKHRDRLIKRTEVKRLHHFREIRGRRSEPLHPLSRHRVREPEAARVKALTLDRENRAVINRLKAAAVHGVSEKREPETLAVDADLMRAAGFETAGDPADHALPCVPERHTGDMGAGGAHRARNVDGKPHRVPGVTADRTVDQRPLRGFASKQRPVLTLHRAFLKLTDKGGFRFKRLRDHHETGRVAVQTMNNAGAGQHPKLRVTEKKTIQQRIVPVTRRRMYNKAGRLIHNDDRVILIRHVKRDIRGREGELLGRRLRSDRDHISLIDRIPHLIDRLSIYRDRALLDPRLKTGARNFGHQGGECLIEPLPGVFR